MESGRQRQPGRGAAQWAFALPAAPGGGSLSAGAGNSDSFKRPLPRPAVQSLGMTSKKKQGNIAPIDPPLGQSKTENVVQHAHTAPRGRKPISGPEAAPRPSTKLQPMRPSTKDPANVAAVKCAQDAAQAQTVKTGKKKK
jgi:hypothetical protein